MIDAIGDTTTLLSSKHLLENENAMLAMGLNLTWQSVIKISSSSVQQVIPVGNFELGCGEGVPFGVCSSGSVDSIQGSDLRPPFTIFRAVITCTAARCSNLSSELLQSTVVLNSNNIFANELTTPIYSEKFNYHSSALFGWPGEGRRLVARIGVDAIETRVRATTTSDPFNLENLNDFYMTIEPSFTFVDYAPLGDDNVVVDITFALPVTADRTPLQTINPLDLIAIVGSFVAGAIVVNVIVSKIHFYIYWLNNKDDQPPKINEETASFLKSCKRKDLSEVENELLYALTFGGLIKFGVQTKHIAKFFTQKYKYKDSSMFEEIFGSVKEYTAKQRVAMFLKHKDRAFMEVQTAATTSSNPVKPAHSTKLSAGERDRYHEYSRKHYIKDKPLSKNDGASTSTSTVTGDARIKEQNLNIMSSLITYELFAFIGQMRNVIQQRLPDEARQRGLEQELVKSVSA
mmetsp:Transcript_25207/g.35208  ORF Transcript_25207/g.35208 Transcript_25207/m.35208 type:complete len:460 (+) Transcript_25207:313-1692(+)